MPNPEMMEGYGNSKSNNGNDNDSDACIVLVTKGLKMTL